jgi:hypothetical protein
MEDEIKCQIAKHWNEREKTRARVNRRQPRRENLFERKYITFAKESMVHVLQSRRSLSDYPKPGERA